jgi:hypothetical protein
MKVLILVCEEKKKKWKLYEGKQQIQNDQTFTAAAAVREREE